MLKVILAGGVRSSLVALSKLHEHGFEIAGVFGFEPNEPTLVSGYVSMEPFCREHGIPYFPFKNINSSKVQKTIETIQPDLFFVVGLSQLVASHIMTIPRLGCVGFHPTKLPRGRGRAPIAWLIIEESEGAANFFLMGEGADDGPIFVQKPFSVTENDDATSIEEKILSSIETALDIWLPDLKKGLWNPIEQNHNLATYFGKRGPDDGWIDWSSTAPEINRIIRASTTPHPGAYTFLANRKLTVFKSRVEASLPIKGVVGSVLIVKDSEVLVQCGDGLVWISGIIAEDGTSVLLRVGQRLGYYAELELHQLKSEISKIKKLIGI